MSAVTVVNPSELMEQAANDLVAAVRRSSVFDVVLHAGKGVRFEHSSSLFTYLLTKEMVTEADRAHDLAAALHLLEMATDMEVALEVQRFEASVKAFQDQDEF